MSYRDAGGTGFFVQVLGTRDHVNGRSEEHTSALQSLTRLSYAVFCLNKKTNHATFTTHHSTQSQTTLIQTITINNNMHDTQAQDDQLLVIPYRHPQPDHKHYHIPTSINRNTCETTHPYYHNPR